MRCAVSRPRKHTARKRKYQVSVTAETFAKIKKLASQRGETLGEVVDAVTGCVEEPKS